jgi:hydrogenase expression/formation protein HypE
LKNADSLKIILGHGSGGRLTHNLIKDLLVKKLGNPILRELSDSAVIDYRDRLAFTTDSFVVSPLVFPGGDIGKLAVCGTINDLVMLGATPEYLSLSLIIEEGLDYAILEKIIDSIALNARRAGVSFVTGDLKVVEKGACDQIFINTSGIGRILNKRKLSITKIKVKDKIIITGSIAEHGLAVLAKRKELNLGFNIYSDCAALHELIIPVLKKIKSVKFLRDPTRGGIATTLNEIAEDTGLGIVIDEREIPISLKSKTACELLGIDPLYIANEGKAILIVAPEDAAAALRLLKKNPLGRKAQIIGEVTLNPAGRVILNTSIGGRRIVDMLTSEPLPRIC